MKGEPVRERVLAAAAPYLMAHTPWRELVTTRKGEGIVAVL